MTKLVDQAQVFGQVIKSMPMGGTPITVGVMGKVMGGTTEVPNNGMNSTPPSADKSAEAYARACQHRNDPFFWIVGKPEK